MAAEHAPRTPRCTRCVWAKGRPVQSARHISRHVDWPPSLEIDVHHDDLESTGNPLVLQYGITVEKQPGVPEDQAMATAVALGAWVKKGFDEDIEIWWNQGPHRQSPVVRGGRPGLSTAALVPAVLRRHRRRHTGHRGRYEFEVDMSHPRQVWAETMAASTAATQVST